MKRSEKIIGAMLVLLLAGFGPLYAQRGMRGMMMDSVRMNRMNSRPGMCVYGNIPGLTDKQKKDIEELRQKQQDEMRKFREEMMGKMKSLRESNREKIMDLLTPEQKKWVEENISTLPER
jgi:Spy/CpxP family protein refolding chaperone